MRTIVAQYLQHSARPLTSLLFVAPLLVLYELGIWKSAGQAVRNAADVWLQDGLSQLGFSVPLLLPAIVLAVLLGRHHLSRNSWYVGPHVLGVMYVECVILASVLIVFATLQQLTGTSELVVPWQHPRWCLLISYVGAGIYEEVFFRLVLLSGIAALAVAIGLPAGFSRGVAILLSSLLFALAHYQTLVPYGEVFEPASFQFRFAAGVLFGTLYCWRGFGIAVGTHVAYDVIVGWG